MHCPRCQHENRPQAKFCEECAGPFKGASPTTRSYADLKSEVESLRQALTEALRAADGDGRDPAGHRELADRPPAGASTPSSRAPPGCAARRCRRSSVWKGELCVWWLDMDRIAPDHVAVGDTIPVSRDTVADGRYATGGRSTSRTSQAAEAEFPMTRVPLRQARGLPDHAGDAAAPRGHAARRRSSSGGPRSSRSRTSRSSSSRPSPPRR